MLNDFDITAIIPARGGSKRLPGKNIKNFCGKPLIAWTIETANQSKYIDNVVVSTDDLTIKEIAQQFGAEVPFIRPEYLSTDFASSFDVINHCIDTLNLNTKNHIVVLLQPTSPLRTFEEVDSALKFYFEKNAKGVVSVSEVEHSPLWANVMQDDRCMENFFKAEVVGKRSQDLPLHYRLNGSIYIYDVFALLENQKIFYNQNVFGFETPNLTAIDIDNELDFLIAETIYKSRLNG